LNKQEASPRLTVLLGVLIALPALGTDLFVPSLPMLARGLQVEVAAAQLTLTAYFFGLAAGQLLWGPLSDRFGRKPVLLSALLLMLASTLAAAFMTSVAAVGSARLIQGLAMSSGAVIARSIVRDLYAHEQAARLLATVTIVFSIVPIAAPLTGALLVGGGSWQAVFWFLAAAAALLLTWTGFGLAETAPAERRSILILCSHIGILSWVSNSAFTLVSGLGVTVGAYSLMFAAVMCGQISGAWSSRRLVPSLGIPRLLRSGAATMLAGGAIAAVLAWSGVAHWGAVVAPFPASAGSASSLIGAIGFTAGAIVSSLLGAAFDGSARPMATVAAFAGTAAFTLEWLLLRGKA
jgi:DHA1 family bicyclomycin/chloramphenicol resistance-like MFS transporter